MAAMPHTAEGRDHARQTYDTALRLANKHMAEAEARLSQARPQVDQHLKFAAVYANIALACQKRPGERF
jgi:hypothetical protein